MKRDVEPPEGFETILRQVVYPWSHWFISDAERQAALDAHSRLNVIVAKCRIQRRMAESKDQNP